MNTHKQRKCNNKKGVSLVIIRDPNSARVYKYKVVTQLIPIKGTRKSKIITHYVE